MPIRPVLTAAAVLLTAARGMAAPGPGGQVDPALPMRVLRVHCLSCHNEEKRKGGLALTSPEAMRQGADEGPVITEGNPDSSPLLQSLAAGSDPHMPPEKQLSPAQIALLTEWVRQGTPWNAAALAGEADPPRPVSLAPLPAAWRPVLALTLSPAGDRLAAGCGNEVVLFDVAADGLTFRARAQAHPDAVQSLAWSADGKTLVSGAFRRLVVWDADSLTLRREIVSGLTDRITAMVALPADGHLLVADGLAGESGIVRELDAASGQIVRSWPAHADTIFAMALSHDGKRLATAGGDHLVKLWDAATGAESARLEAHASQVLGVAFHPDDSQLVTGGADRQLKVWDASTRENVIALASRSAAISAVQWSTTDPAVFAVTEDGAVLKYTDLKTHTGAQSSESGRERQLGRTDAAVYCLTVSAAGDRIYAGTRDARILGWDKDGKQTSNVDAASAAAPPPDPAP